MQSHTSSDDPIRRFDLRSSRSGERRTLCNDPHDSLCSSTITVTNTATRTFSGIGQILLVKIVLLIVQLTNPLWFARVVWLQ